jgi:cephalosporin-C deacetylase-like acetyl esterase
MKIKLLAASTIAVFSPHVAESQQTDPTVKVEVTLDRRDWKYSVGDTARFTVAVRSGGRPVPGVQVVLELGEVRLRPIATDTIVVGTSARPVVASLPRPGFVRLVASTRIGNSIYRDTATAAFDPEKIESATSKPADFEKFWTSTIEAARRTPLAPVMTKMPQRSTPEVDVYHISFQNDRVGSRIYGILSVPTKPGKYPAVLTVPGAGARPYFPDITLAKRGIIRLSIGIHGIPVDRDSLLYNELRATALARYFTYGIESRDTYYYKRVFAGLLRAGDFIFGLPQFDGQNYLVQGSSQGGGLAIVAGALDDRVKGIVVAYPAMSDHLAYLEGRTGGWPHHFVDTVGMRAIPEKVETLRYYDVVNFARLLKVPGFYSWGYNDNVVPPSSSYAAFNVITAPKEVLIVPETAHFKSAAQERREREWILEKLGLAK